MMEVGRKDKQEVQALMFFFFQQHIMGRHGLMVMPSDCGLRGWGSNPGRDKSLTPAFVFT